MDKYSSASGLFWGMSLFLGLLIAVLIGFNTGNWLMSGIIGVCVFLILGLAIQGIITLLQKK